jgi:branched-chain amino acid transport system substrate-binding protein
MRSVGRSWSFLLGPIVLPLLLVACGGGEEKAVVTGTPTAVSGTATPAATSSAAAEVPGITDTKIILGSHTALSGSYGAVYASLTKGLQAYFRYVNEEKGGVCGRQIDLRVEDDQYDPAKALEVTRKLVEQDKVFAMVAGLGTPAHSAVWEYLNENGVPDLWIMSGAHKWGADPAAHPWSVAILPDYYVEGAIFGKYISENLPGKTVAVLLDNNDAGWDRLDGLKSTLDPAKNRIVAEQPFEVTDISIQSQVTNAKQSDAEIALCFSLPGYCAQGIEGANRLGWHPQWMVAYVNADVIMFLYAPPKLMEGVISLQGNKMYNWTDDPAVAEHHRIMKEYGGPAPDNFSIVGEQAGELTVEALSRTCDNLTREGLMAAVESIQDYQGDLNLPGVKITLSDTDHYAIEQMKMLKATVVDGKGNWEYFGDLFSFR